MTAEQYLKAVIERNPALGKPDDEKITLTARGIRNLIKQAHAMGVQQGKHEAAVKEKLDGMFSHFRAPWE